MWNRTFGRGAGHIVRSLLQIRVLNDEGGKDAEAQSESDDIFLRKIEATMLTQVCTLCTPFGRDVALQGVCT